MLASASQFVAELKGCTQSNSDKHYIHGRMRDIDAWAGSVLEQTAIEPSVTKPIDFRHVHRTEHVTSSNIRLLCRIKLNSGKIKTHRFQAFCDIPIFIKKHCDLSAADSGKGCPSQSTKAGSQSSTSLSCSCGEDRDLLPTSPGQYILSPASSTPSDPHCTTDSSIMCGSPFSNEYSVKTCLLAAIDTSILFERLSKPKPLQAHLAYNSKTGDELPRTMPSFACCLMQSSYALLMVFYKALATNQIDSETGTGGLFGPADQFCENVQEGLRRLIRTLNNYSLAFEALDGMRGRLHTFFFFFFGIHFLVDIFLSI